MLSLFRLDILEVKYWHGMCIVKRVQFWIHLIGLNMKNNYLTSDDFYYACKELESGRHGSFARAIAEAYVIADRHNSKKLVEAFPDLFERGYHFWQARKLMTD